MAVTIGEISNEVTVSPPTGSDSSSGAVPGSSGGAPAQAQPTWPELDRARSAQSELERRARRVRVEGRHTIDNDRAAL